MAKDHFIPAAVLGIFSDEGEVSLRSRRIAIQRDGRNPYVTRAENVGYVNNLYDLDDQEAKTVDSSWSEYEHRLPQAISILEESQPLEADAWLRVLVPYVTSLFVRGHERETRYQARFDAWTCHLAQALVIGQREADRRTHALPLQPGRRGRKSTISARCGAL